MKPIANPFSTDSTATDPIAGVVDALTDAGWRSRGGVFRPGRHRKLSVRASRPSRRWQRFVSSPLVLRPRRGAPVPAFFDAALAPVGPFQLVPANAITAAADAEAAGAVEGAVRLVADVPFEAARPSRSPACLPDDFLARVGTDPRSFFAPDGDVPLRPWADNLRDALCALAGKRRANGATSARRVPASLGPLDADAIAARLNGAGWIASAAESVVRINFESRRGFCQARLTRSEPSDTRIEVELTTTAEWSADAFAAAADVARSVVEQHRLVRIVHRCAPEDVGRIVAQVSLGSLSVDSPWLAAALACLRTASAALIHELPLLADSEFARWVLSSTRCSRERAAHPESERR